MYEEATQPLDVSCLGFECPSLAAAGRDYPQFGRSLRNVIRHRGSVFGGSPNRGASGSVEDQNRTCRCGCGADCAGDGAGCRSCESSKGCGDAKECNCLDCGESPTARIRHDELEWDLPLSGSGAEVHLIQLFARGIDLVRVSPPMGNARTITALVGVYRRHGSSVAWSVTRADIKRMSAIVQALGSAPPEARASLLYDMVQSEIDLNTAADLCTYVGGGPVPCVDNGCFRMSDFLDLAYRRCEELIVGGVDPRKPRPPKAEPGGDPWGGNECLCVRYTIDDIPWWLRLLIELLLAACTAALLAKVLGYLLRYRRLVGVATA
jgi:hypothetical protein